MKITKILNNNAVIIKDDSNQEQIALGAGIGFNKGKNDVINEAKIDRLYVLKENEKLQELLLQLPEKYFTISKAIILHAEKQLDTELNDHILLALTDHIAFAVEREKQDIHLKNKLLQEIKVLYREEYAIGLWAIKHIKEKTGVEMLVDEAAFIALHIHTMKIKGGDMSETLRQTAIISDMVSVVEEFLNITIEVEAITYERLVTHLRFALTRVGDSVHAMDMEMLEMIKRKFDVAFECAKDIAKMAEERYHIYLPEEELGYISLHIERLRQY